MACRTPLRIAALTVVLVSGGLGLVADPGGACQRLRRHRPGHRVPERGADPDHRRPQLLRLGSHANNAHIHGPAGVGVNAAVVFGLSGVPAATSGSVASQTFNVTAARRHEVERRRGMVTPRHQLGGAADVAFDDGVSTDVPLAWR